MNPARQSARGNNGVAVFKTTDCRSVCFRYFRHGHGPQGTSDDKSVRPGRRMRQGTGEAAAAGRPLAVRGK